MQAEISFACGADILGRVRSTGILPTESEAAHLSDEERELLPAVWVEGMARAASVAAAAQRKMFEARGWAFRWFSRWVPSSKADASLAEAIEAAIAVADQHMPRITQRDFDAPENMGILQSKGFGGAEGIQVKRDPYGHLVLVSVHCFTGPANFSVGEDVEFEDGAKSHVFHLVYDQLPNAETVVGDLAAYPLIKKVCNHKSDRMGGMWLGEGWTGPHQSRPRVHRPWNATTDDIATA